MLMYDNQSVKDKTTFMEQTKVLMKDSGILLSFNLFNATSFHSIDYNDETKRFFHMRAI
jgi:hypothetical protein